MDQRQRTLKAEPSSVVAFTVSFIVGPLACLLGLVALFRISRNGRGGRALAIAAIAVGVLQTLVVVLLIANWHTPEGDDGGSASPTSPTSPTAPSSPPSALEVPPSEDTAPTSPSDSDGPSLTGPPSGDWPRGEVGSFLAQEVAGFEALGFVEDPEATASGAVDAYAGSYGDGRDEIVVRVSMWVSPDVAAQTAAEVAERQFGPEYLLAEGDVGSPTTVGHYLYYEREGRASIFWNDGVFMISASGEPYPVQEFFVQYPQR